MMIKIDSYPETFSFELDFIKGFPKFTYGCPLRSAIAQMKMAELNIDSPAHDYRDYIVEQIESREGQEIWHIGS